MHASSIELSNASSRGSWALVRLWCCESVISLLLAELLGKFTYNTDVVYNNVLTSSFRRFYGSRMLYVHRSMCQCPDTLNRSFAAINGVEAQWW
jgi:hypothetical protein